MPCYALQTRRSGHGNSGRLRDGVGQQEVSRCKQGLLLPAVAFAFPTGQRAAELIQRTAEEAPAAAVYLVSPSVSHQGAEQERQHHSP